MKNKIQIFTELPSLNEYIDIERKNKFAASLIKKRKTAAVAAEISTQKCIIDPHGLYDLKIEWYFKDKRKDPDNVYFAVKFILDGAVNNGLLKNDGQKNIRNILNIHAGFCSNPYCVVEFIPIQRPGYISEKSEMRKFDYSTGKEIK